MTVRCNAYTGRRFSVAAMVFAVAIGQEDIVFAQAPSDPVALELKRRGDAAIESGQYEAALEAYSRALDVEPGPALHYNRGRALQALSRNAEALSEFELFFRTASESLRAAVPQLTDMIAQTRSRVAELSIACKVQGANVTIGTRVLPLPLEAPLRFDPGNLTVIVAADGYEPYRSQITLRGGERRELVATLKKPDLRAHLRVNSGVAGALVRVDGRVIGSVPAEVALAPGVHQVALSHDGYRDATSQVVLKERERRSLSVALEPTPRIYERWWFWVAAGLLAAGGVALGVALNTERSPARGDIPPGQITAPLQHR